MQNKGPALAPVSLSPTSMIPDSPSKFRSTALRPDEIGTALQVGTLANKADFFEQASSRIPPFLKPQRQTPCNRAQVLAAATVYPLQNFYATHKRASDRNHRFEISNLKFLVSNHAAEPTKRGLNRTRQTVEFERVVQRYSIASILRLQMPVCHRLGSLMVRAVCGLTERGLSNVRLRLNLLGRHHSS